jgi:hypothetical protein
MSKTFSEKILRKPTKFSVSVFPQLFFVLSRFLGVSWRWEFKSTTKNVLQTNRVEKFFKKSQKKSDQPWYFFGPRGTNQPRLP